MSTFLQLGAEPELLVQVPQDGDGTVVSTQDGSGQRGQRFGVGGACGGQCVVSRGQVDDRAHRHGRGHKQQQRQEILRSIDGPGMQRRREEPVEDQAGGD